MPLYVLANPDLKIPMPDRDCRLFGPDGEQVSEQDAYYARLIADGDIVPVKEPAKAKAEKPAVTDK